MNTVKLNAMRNPVARSHQKIGSGSGLHKVRRKLIPRKQKYKELYF